LRGLNSVNLDKMSGTLEPYKRLSKHLYCSKTFTGVQRI
jgi:hypothetical protein